MSIPLDKLYDFLDNCINHDLIIYRFLPHGSKNLRDLLPLKEYTDQLHLHTTPMAIYHDQEPLSFDLYSLDELLETYRYYQPTSDIKLDFDNPNRDLLELIWDMHIRGVGTTALANLYDKTILVHSEQNSEHVTKFEQQGYVPVYYWSHAMIARDWFRYAQHDLALQHKEITKDFLIYNRSWSGTREYRLKFAELLLEHNLLDKCLTSFNAWCDNKHFLNHCYVNPDFEIQNHDLEKVYVTNTWQSWASADYQYQDYQHTRLEVVLETMYDDQRWHLTEKILRPIACGQPFLLMSTPGSLAFLRNYGFKTFGEFWDEDYDTIQDPLKRMSKVIDVMQHIANMESHDKHALFDKIQDICLHNKTWFFSKEFHELVVNEYVSNMTKALDGMQKHFTGYWFRRCCLFLHQRNKVLWPEFMPRSLAKQLWIRLKT